MRTSTLFDWGTALSAITTSGALHPIGPAAAVSIARGYHAYGPSLGLLIAVSAARHPDRIALIDESGAVTYRELMRRSEAFAAALHSLTPDLRTVGILCRDHRGFVDAVIAGSRLGCELVFLNTELPPPWPASWNGTRRTSSSTMTNFLRRSRRWATPASRCAAGTTPRPDPSCRRWISLPGNGIRPRPRPGSLPGSPC
ncbi:AMP-binding protein [Nocardia sp. NPDC059091]|uniref:AMP-binding protein n=1 Tax=unclassified Nocardia TaxID=2637762 RepID=UPI0036C15A97